jgi:hypothetical protein
MIFISHSSQDDEFVTRLHIALQRRGYSTWVDHITNIPPGITWDVALEESLRKCNVMILVLSNAALNSQVVGAEWRQFFSDGKLIIPVKIENCVPPLLIRHLQYLDFIDDTILLNHIDKLIHALPPEEQNGAKSVVTRVTPDDVSLDIVEFSRFQHIAAKLNRDVQQRLQYNQIALLFPDSNKVLPVQLKRVMSIGWTDSFSRPDIDLRSHNASECGVSRLHASLTWTDDGIRVADLASANGTYIDGYRLPPEKPVLVRNKNILQLAQLTIILFLKEPVNQEIRQ